MMLHLVAGHHGSALANGISDMFVCDRIRDSHEPQRLRMENHVFASQPKLASAVQLIEANIEEPIDLAEVAAYSGLSRRQLERLFLNFLGITPSRFYLKVRLERAKQLLRQTTCSIVDISSICGFESTTHFNRTYKKYMRHSPKAERGMRATLGSNLVLTEETTGLIPNSAALALASAMSETSFGAFSNDEAGYHVSQDPVGLGEG
jgi:transcriptional regulator GlxA family with amidase domain